MPKFVHPTGPKSASIAFIGEAPGAEEDRLGKPFVGRSGHHFNNLLQAVGLRREDVYITNTIKFRPPANNIKAYIDLSKKIPVTTAGYTAAVRQLKTELELTSANVFVPLGNVSLYALTGIHPGKITARRGSLLECSLVPGRKVIPTIHPAAALRKYVYSNFIAADLRRIVKESSSREIKLPQPNLIIEPTYLEVIDYLEQCSERELVNFDVEGVFDFSCISFSHHPSSAICIPFSTPQGNYFSTEQETSIWERIGYLLEDPTVRKLNQNMAYDATAIHRQQGIITNPIDDTMLAQCILFPDYPRDLGFITRMWTRYNYYKDEGIEWIKSGIKKGADITQLWHYNAMDSIIPMVAFPQMVKMLKLTKNWDSYKVGRELIQPCLFMQARGVRVDVEGMKVKDDELERQKAATLDEFHEICGEPINPNSPTQLIKYLYETKKYPKHYENKKLTSNEKALKRLVGQGCEEAKLILSIRHDTKQQQYLRMKLDSDKRLKCFFNVSRARSSRLSSSKLLFEFGGNLQTLPKKTAIGDPKPFRKFLLADDGMVLCKVDLSMAENRIVAYIGPDLNMIEAFEAGKDLHIMTAALIEDKKYEDVTKQERNDIGKPANHGCNYGEGPMKLAETYGLSVKRAKFIIKRYLESYPGVEHYHYWVMDKAKSDRTLVNCFGRHQTFRDRLTSSEAGKGATIFYWIPQSTVSDIINRYGMLHIYNDQKIYKDVELLLQVHDEIDFQYPLSMSIEQQFSMLSTLKTSLEQPLYWKGQEFVVPADFEFGFNLWETDELGHKNWNFENFKKLIEELRRC